MIPSLVLIKTISNHRIFFFFKSKIQLGINEKCDIIINHPLFFKKIHLIETSRKKIAKSENNHNFSRHFFSHQYLTDENLSVKMFSPGWIFYCITIFIIGVFIFYRYNFYRCTNIPHQDWSSIPLPANKTYGFCRNDLNHPVGIRFLFNSGKVSAHDLSFTAGSSQNNAHFSISLNEQVLPFKIPISKGWGKRISIRLPIQMTNIGLNQLEFRIITPSKDLINWGIRDVAIIHREIPNNNIYSASALIDKVRSVLQQENINGPQLRELYLAVVEMQEMESSDDFTDEINTLKQEIEKRMETLLKKTLLLLKATRINKDVKSSGKILRNTRMWLPRKWTKGLEILGEFDHKK